MTSDQVAKEEDRASPVDLAAILCTAKVRCTAKSPAGDGQTRLGFSADYAEGRNAEWAMHDTPVLSLTMVVRDEVAARISTRAMALLFTEDVDV